MTYRCPCCGQTVEGIADLEALASVPLTKMERRLVETVIGAHPRPVSTAAILGALYVDDPNGGPLDGVNMVSVLLNRIRKKVRPLGWHIGRTKDASAPLHGVEGISLRPLEKGAKTPEEWRG